jgi:cell migration-inducing and hyaluronan-binding protein
VENTTFVNYADNDTRKTGALSYLMYTSAGVSTENAIEGATFVNAKPVYFPQMGREWANDNLGGVAWRTAVFHDKDGSVGGIPNAYILINDGENDSIATDREACEIKPDWNAAVCRGDVGRLNLGGAGGGFGPRGGGAPRAGGAGPGAVAAGGPGAGAPRAGGAGPGAGGPITAGGRAGGAGRAPAQPPVVLSRNGRDYPVTQNQSNVRAGTEIRVTTERPDVSLSLREMDEGSWVIFELPGFATAASGAEQSSLDALRTANVTSYFKDNDALWVKVVSNGDGARGPIGGGPGAGTSLQVSR